MPTDGTAALVALVLCLVYLVAVFGVQSWRQWARTGRTGWVPVYGRPRPEVLADVLFVFALALDLAAPALALSGLSRPIAPLDQPLLHAGGIVLFVVCTAGAMAAQRAMGSAWRTGIDRSRVEPLIIHGPFRLVRNPVYATMLGASLASALLVSNVPAVLGLLTCLVALEVQTRAVEEPHLLAVHGQRYRLYAARVGRFLPRLGRIRPSS